MDGRGHDEREAPNVVRLPRDWVGPPGELVPVGPRARARERERLAREARETSQADGPTAEAHDAGGFWSEGAGALHEAVRAPNAPPAAGPGAPGSARRRRHLLGEPRFFRPRPAFSVRSVLAGSLVAVAIAAVVVAAVGFGERAPRPTASNRTSARDAAASRSRPSHSGLTHGAEPDRSLAAVPVRSESERPSVVHVAGSRSRPGNSQRPKPSHRVVGNRTGATDTTVVTETVTAPSTSSPPAPTVSEPVATAASVGGTSGESTSTTDPGASSSSQTSGGPAGPSGPGSASGCDPKCS